MQSRRLVNVKLLAEMYSLPIPWIYRKAEQGKLPHIKAGKYLLFDPEEVLLVLRERGAELAGEVR